jgi:transposase
MARTDLNEKQWRVLEPHLPANPKRGHVYVEHRRVIDGVVWRLKTGAPWRDIPERYGPWQTCWDRFTRWERDGTWVRLLQTLQAHADAEGDIDWDGAASWTKQHLPGLSALDSSHIKAHRSATGARHQSAKGEKRGV